MNGDHEDQPKVWFDGYLTAIEERLEDLDKVACQLKTMVEEDKERCQRIRAQNQKD